jgi:DNA-binding IscR family transcriptional regulator
MHSRFDYAIALIEYIRKRNGAFVDVGTAGAELKLPPAYLEKVAQGLKKGGILEGRRGAGGGYRLANKSVNISVETLINFYEPRYNFCPVLRGINKS